MLPWCHWSMAAAHPRPAALVSNLFATATFCPNEPCRGCSRQRRRTWSNNSLGPWSLVLIRDPYSPFLLPARMSQTSPRGFPGQDRTHSLTRPRGFPRQDRAHFLDKAARIVVCVFFFQESWPKAMFPFEMSSREGVWEEGHNPFAQPRPSRPQPPCTTSRRILCK